MDKDQWLTAAVLAVLLIGLPVGALVYACQDHITDRKPTDREIYPDEHLGI